MQDGVERVHKSSQKEQALQSQNKEPRGIEATNEEKAESFDKDENPANMNEFEYEEEDKKERIEESKADENERIDENEEKKNEIEKKEEEIIEKKNVSKKEKKKSHKCDEEDFTLEKEET